MITTPQRMLFFPGSLPNPIVRHIRGTTRTVCSCEITFALILVWKVMIINLWKTWLMACLPVGFKTWALNLKYETDFSFSWKIRSGKQRGKTLKQLILSTVNIFKSKWIVGTFSDFFLLFFNNRKEQQKLICLTVILLPSGLAIYSIICLYSVFIFTKHRCKKLIVKAALELLFTLTIGDSNTSLSSWASLSQEGRMNRVGHSL